MKIYKSWMTNSIGLLLLLVLLLLFFIIIIKIINQTTG